MMEFKISRWACTPLICTAAAFEVFLNIAPIPFCIAGPILDSDGDMLLDSYETGTGTFVSEMDTGTSPTDADSDDDGSPDGMEVQKGLDPNNPLSRLERPNIIFLLADDLGYGDLGCFHQDAKSGNKFDTPEIDLMAEQGMKLTHHYVSAPVCAPSRASFLSGRHQGHANVRNTQFDKALEDNQTIARMLQRAGYYTAHLGKYGLAGKINEPELPAHPNSRGFDYFLGYLFHDHAHEHYPRNGTTGKAAFVYENLEKITNAYVDIYTTDLWTARAKKLIVDETVAHPNRPFFLYIGYDTPHFALQYPPGEYPSGRGTGGGLEWVGHPAYCNTASNDASRIDSWIHPDFASQGWPNNNIGHAAMIRRIDESVGDLLQTLVDLGIDDNTLVIFSSDNGPQFESHDPRLFESFGKMDGIKRDLWEAGIRVPTIAWWPGNVGVDVESDFPSGNWDWMPTFAELAQTPVPAWCDGVSLVPTLTQTGVQDDKGYLYFEIKLPRSTPDWANFEPSRRGRLRGEMQAVRMGDFTGVRTSVGGYQDPFEIYNVVDDPKQITNLVGTAPFFDSLQIAMQNRTMQVRRPAEDIVRPYDLENTPSVNLPVLPGLLYFAHEGLWPWLPDFSALIPVSTGTVSNLDLTVRTRDDDVGIAFVGYLDVPADGAYIFYLTSDTGAGLWVHDAHVIEADYGYDGSERSATMNLDAGLHPVRLYYRHTIGPHQLELEYAGPSMSRQPVPNTAFFQPASIGPGPVANDDASSTFLGNPVLVNVMGNDYDDGGATNIFVQTVGKPFGGTASNLHGRILYTPEADFLGQDFFDYSISDGLGTGTARVQVSVYYPSTNEFWLPFNEITGFIAHEAGGQPLGKLTGYSDPEQPWAGGRFGRALYCNGSNSSVQVQSSYQPPHGSADRSVTAWIRTNSGGAIAAWGSNDTSKKWVWRIDPVHGGVLRIEVTGGHVRGVRDLRDDLWHHVAVTFENDGTPDVLDCILYVNGLAEQIGSSAGRSIVTDPTALEIGTDFSQRFFAGIIDELRIYNRALSAAEIMEEFRSTHQSAIAWHRRYFGDQSVNWMMDLDDDYLVRLAEYALGGNPKIPELYSLGLRPFLDSGDGMPRAVYNRRLHGTHELVYTGEASGDLVQWDSLMVNELESMPHPTLPGFEEVTVETDASAGAQSNQFLRVNVELQP